MAFSRGSSILWPWADGRHRPQSSDRMGEYTEVAKEDKEAGREATKEADAMDKEEEEEEEAPMSLVRKAAFISSIVFSLLLCAVFLWGLPCDLATCIAPTVSTNTTETFTSARPRSTEM